MCIVVIILGMELRGYCRKKKVDAQNNNDMIEMTSHPRKRNDDVGTYLATVARECR